jgi:hypothetical protein
LAAFWPFMQAGFWVVAVEAGPVGTIAGALLFGIAGFIAGFAAVAPGAGWFCTGWPWLPCPHAAQASTSETGSAKLK